VKGVHLTPIHHRLPHLVGWRWTNVERMASSTSMWRSAWSNFLPYGGVSPTTSDNRSQNDHVLDVSLAQRQFSPDRSAASVFAESRPSPIGRSLT
jgi:hypothetical protein